MRIIKAGTEDLNGVAELFDEYRQLYNQTKNLKAAKAFISERLANDDSKILLAVDKDGKAVGFTQLYPAFSSVAMKPMWHLNDLYVIETSRKNGVAEALLEAARDLASTTGALTIKLATAIDNIHAKALYEKVGYSKVIAFDHYTQKVVKS